jgi:hypothetical protein
MPVFITVFSARALNGLPVPQNAGFPKLAADLL